MDTGLFALLHLLEYAKNFAAATIDKRMLTISSMSVFSRSFVLFQRLSVVVSDVVLFDALDAFCLSWPTVTTTEWVFSSPNDWHFCLLQC